MYKSVVFLMPCIGRTPVGGFKVVYEYANRLVNDGFDVKIVYPATYDFSAYNATGFSDFSFKNKVRIILRYLYYRANGRYTCRSWFQLDSSVLECWRWDLSEKLVPASDFYIATAVQTAEALNRYQKVQDSSKFYFIQGYENWHVDESRLLASYKYPMKKISIANWLDEVIREKGGSSSVVINNGFDFDFFQCRRSISARDRFHIALMYSSNPMKGFMDAMRALLIVKERFPRLSVALFGTSPCPKGLPAWIDYTQMPDRDQFNDIYNNAAIFIAPSHSEGWGLTVGEAMICGCAIVCTDTKGYLEMVVDGINALVSPVGDMDKMTANIIRLIEQDALRIEIAETGRETIKKFTWDRAYQKFKKQLMFEQLL